LSLMIFPWSTWRRCLIEIWTLRILQFLGCHFFIIFPWEDQIEDLGLIYLGAANLRPARLSMPRGSSPWNVGGSMGYGDIRGGVTNYPIEPPIEPPMNPP
jgi:hypothetical protein